MNIVNGDSFFKIKTWPEEKRKSLSEMYEHLSSCFSGLRWILTLQTWSAEKAEKRAQQINFILNNEDGKRSQWFYFDMNLRKLLYLNKVWSFTIILT